MRQNSVGVQRVSRIPNVVDVITEVLGLRLPEFTSWHVTSWVLDLDKLFNFFGLSTSICKVGIMTVFTS